MFPRYCGVHTRFPTHPWVNPVYLFTFAHLATGRWFFFFRRFLFVILRPRAPTSGPKQIGNTFFSFLTKRSMCMWLCKSSDCPLTGRLNAIEFLIRVWFCSFLYKYCNVALLFFFVLLTIAFVQGSLIAFLSIYSILFVDFTYVSAIVLLSINPFDYFNAIILTLSASQN